MQMPIARLLSACLLAVLPSWPLAGQEKKDDPDPAKPVEFKGEAKVNAHPYKMEKGATYRITAQADGFEPVLMIRNASRVVAAVEGVKGEARLVYTAAESREHEIRVEFSATGKIDKGPSTYTVVVERAQFAAEKKVKEPLALNEQTVKMSRGKFYAITVRSKGFAADVRIALGTKILAHELSSGFAPRPPKDKGERELITKLTFIPSETAEYRILVTPPPQLPQRKKGPPEPEKTDFTYTTTIAELKIALSVTEKLTKKDPVYKGRGPHRTHELKLEADKTYQIDLRSDDFDSYLLLEDSAGKVLEADDDGGGFPHARIVFTPTKAGAYRVIATTYKADAAGSYTLTVIENPDARLVPPSIVPNKERPPDNSRRSHADRPRMRRAVAAADADGVFAKVLDAAFP
jgi:hypothetical protein